MSVTQLRSDLEKIGVDIRQHVRYTSFRIELPNCSRFKANVARKNKTTWEVSLTEPFEGFKVRTDADCRRLHRGRAKYYKFLCDEEMAYKTIYHIITKSLPVKGPWISTCNEVDGLIEKIKTTEDSKAVKLYTGLVRLALDKIDKIAEDTYTIDDEPQFLRVS